MHIRISYIYPSPPRANEAHDLIVEWVGLNPGNLTGNVSRSVFGETPTFAISTRHENMDAFEKSRDAMMASSEIHEFTSKLSPLLRQPTNVTIANALTIGESPADNTRYTHRTRFHPGPGNVGRIHALLGEFTEAEQAAGRTTYSLFEQHYDPTGLIFIGRDTYQSLDEYENVVRVWRTI